MDWKFGGGGTDNQMNFEWSITPRIRTLAGFDGGERDVAYYRKTVNISWHIRTNRYKKPMREVGERKRKKGRGKKRRKKGVKCCWNLVLRYDYRARISEEIVDAYG